MGQFGPAQTLLTDPVLPKLEALDMDGDGDLDLVGYFNDLHFKWAQNTNGAGVLLEFAPLIESPNASAYVFGDVNGDGLPDLVFTDASHTIQLVMNLDNGSFGTPTPIQTLNGPTGRIILADVSGNSFPEIIATIPINGDARIAVFPNTSGTFGSQFLLPTLINGEPPSILLAGDMDGNGGIDLIFIDEMNAAIGLMNVNGNGSEFQASTLFNLFNYMFIDPLLIDVDGDGDLDIAEAHQTVVQWADNRINEDIPFNAFTIRVVEPAMTAGIGAFGNLGCGDGASVVYIPSNPQLPVRWSTYLPATQRFAPRQDLPGLPRGSTILLADMNGDGKDDLLIGNQNGLLLFNNQLLAPTTVVEAPAMDTVCVSGPSIPLPQGLPEDGTWSGTWISDNIFHRASVGGTSTVPLAYTWYEPEGCPVGDLTTIRVITGPSIQPFLGSMVCSGDGPFQMSSIPEATEWFGLSEGNILDLTEYNGEQIVATYQDGTGVTCVSFMGPLNVWNSVPASIVEVGPLCITDDVQTIVPELAWGNNTWGGAISGTSGSNALFDPSQGAGTYTITLSRTPTGPQQCANTDSITIVVSDDLPELTLTQPPAYCASTSSIILDMAEPFGGEWSGPGVTGDVLIPFIAGPGTHELTYTFQGSGCSASEQITITLASSVTISTEDEGPLNFCIDDGPINLEAVPQGGEWSAPVSADGIFDPSTVGPGEHSIVYVYTDPNGCMLVNPPTIAVVNEEPTTVNIEQVGTVCLADMPFEVNGSPAGMWSGAVAGEGTSVIFDPMELGVGIWTISLTAAEHGFCPATTSMDIEVEICTGMSTLSLAPSISVAPNPTTGLSWLQLHENGPVELMLLDASGRIVRQFPHSTAGTGAIPLDLSPLANGLYHLRVVQGDGSQQIKILKTD